ncbi:single-stranded-DNA-specific exonuclease RecJ [Fulvivirga lutea]|uniref:Single-stranded-DNA-specific exonuclease RecJ n=1 Tax=Fulvivirga lutea TaxID=2810512 RepID=A0A974WH69_9BACT|nr:single-stranded-DNA-specific exonuclease RecJ [Fulvivirga lutea]QSE98296.1 single-stranded-DNA-specific exonuclease RecJ [Fulvivirga lutea]
MNKRWNHKPIPNQEVVEALCKSINVSVPLGTIIAQRGITTFDEAKDFFRPSLDHLHDPFLMKGMDKAVARIITAFENDEKILVYGDYDVDGTTSVALCFGYINSFHHHSEFYIPDRYKEGYGISKQGIEYAHENGFSLIIALDCGIKSVELIDYANDLGIDFIICDHHLPGETVPNAVAVLDPKQEDCPYPYKELSGCGIGFKLIQAISDQLDSILVDPFEFLDLVVISIASDIVPITGENRILAYYGLLQLEKAQRPGLNAMVHLAGIQKKLTITGIVFGIAPRINAAGRISHAKGAVDMLLAETEDEAYHYAEKLNIKNDKRREVDSSITQEALAMIEENNGTVTKSTVLFKEDWHKGVVGIVASRCIEKHYKPTIILTKSDDKATGSARSVYGFDVYNAIDSCRDLLDHFGGHKYAAGLTLPIDNVPLFQQKFEEVVSSTIPDDLLIPQIEIDAELNFDSITPNFYKVLNQMEPFGPENLAPIFYTDQVKLASSLRILKDKHLKLFLKQENNEQSFECIGFGLSDLKEQLEATPFFRIAYSIEMNEFRGMKTLQLNIKDIQFD